VDRFLRKPEVLEVTGLSEATIWRMEKAGTFPRRRRCGPNSIAYLASEISAWLESRVKVELGSGKKVPPKAAPAQGKAA